MKQPVKIRVCNSQHSCSVFGGREVMKEIEKNYHISAGEKNEEADIGYCGCLGYCGLAPNVQINDSIVINQAKPKTIIAEIEKVKDKKIDPRVINPDDESIFDI